MGEGVGQAKDYAERLQTRFAYASNGKAIYRIDMHTGQEGPVDCWPTPQELWDATFAEANLWRDRFAAVPYETGGKFEPRYYQYNAIEKSLAAIAAGKDRVLLTLATGTGKTAMAFQIAWKLFQARWNLGDWKNDNEPSRRPRILFLADRNILADQAYNSFSAFEDDALAGITPHDIRKKGRVPKNAQCLLHDLPDLHVGSDEKVNQALLRRLSARLLRFHHHRRMPPGRSQGRERMARDSGIFRARRADRPDRHAQAQGQRRYLRLFRRSGLHLFAERGDQRRLSDPVQSGRTGHHDRRICLHPRR